MAVSRRLLDRRSSGVVQPPDVKRAILRVMPPRPPRPSRTDTGRRSRGRELLFALPLGLLAAIALWIGDDRLTRRDWVAGALVFGVGLAATFLMVRQLRRAGVVR